MSEIVWMISTPGCRATTSLMPSSRFLVLMSVTSSRTFRIRPLPPMSSISFSAAVMAAALMSVATVNGTGVGRPGSAP